MKNHYNFKAFIVYIEIIFYSKNIGTYTIFIIIINFF